MNIDAILWVVMFILYAAVWIIGTLALVWVFVRLAVKLWMWWNTGSFQAQNEGDEVMNESPMGTLVRRLNQVERRSRRLKWVIALLAVVMFAGFALELAILETELRAPVSSRILYTQGVYLKALGPGDLWDRPATGVFAITRDGATVGSTLRILGSRGTIVLGSPILPGDEGPQLTLYDKKGQGKARAVLQLDKEGEPSLALYDEERRIRAMLGSVTLPKTRPGRDKSKAEIEEKIPAGLVFFDKDGKVIWSAP